MNKKEYLGRIREIEEHNRRYYEESRPRITDEEYDRLLAEVREVETAHPEWVSPDSPTRRIGGRPSGGFKTAAHRAAMLSIDNTYS
ncbi:MAG: NAD-dependent DNA ligase LigA, partial [Candidatus Omnitrophica bacterium]|nr:NAD-dependent DNA ligase LigA [Candidatus Omnitrophota bacterium]